MISEAASKKKRGRPRAIHPEWEGFLRSSKGTGFSARQIQNQHYFDEGLQALHLLPNDEKHRDDLCWLADWDASSAAFHSRVQGDRGKIKFGIISELGRLAESDGNETAQVVAEQICRIKPSVKKGIAMVRRVRLGEKPGGSAIGLGRELERAINQYRALHEDISLQVVLDALSLIDDEVRELMEDGAE